MSTPHVEVLPDKPALVDRALTLVVEKIRGAVAERGRCTIALAGGSTPKPLYEALAQQSLPWEQLYILWGDERYVPISHPDSNAGMAKAAWLDQVPIPPSHILAMPTSGDPASDAALYESMLKTLFLGSGETPPTLDIVLLGMGDDGHTASLFPHTEALAVADRWVTVGEKQGEPRITLTVPLLNQAQTVLFMVAGANKQTALKQVFSPDGDSQRFPSRLIQPRELWWLLDEAAGAALQPA